MESIIVNKILLIVLLLNNYSVNGILGEVIIIDKKVPIKNGELEQKIIPRDVYQWKPLDIEIETPWENRTTIGIFKDTGCVIRKKLSLEDNQNFRYCLKNKQLHVKKEKDLFLRINLVNRSTKLVEKTTEKIPRRSEINKAERNENIINKNCRIYLDLYCENVVKNVTSFNYRKWLFYPVKIDNQNDDADLTYKNSIHRINSSGYEKMKFDVNESTIEIRILVKGNLSFISIEIPIDSKWYNTEPTTLSLARTDDDSGGLEIVALNAPPGGWLLKLIGEGASKYSFLVEKKIIRCNINRNNTKLDENYSMKFHNDNDSDYRKYEENKQGFNNVETFDELSQNSQEIVLNDESSEFVEIRGKRNEPEVNVENLHVPLSSIQTDQGERVRSRSLNDRSSKIIFENDDVNKANINVSRMIQNINTQELSNEYARLGDDEKEEKRRIVVELNQNSNLFVRPGTIHRIAFDVTNNHYQTIRCDFKVRSLPLIVVNVQPISTWIYAGRTINVFVDVEVPRGTTQDVINTLTLYVQGSEITEKSVYLYVEGNIPNVVDDTKPAIEYTFNNNCASKLSKEKCTKSRWSVDIRIQDSGSGLKSVKSSPNEVYPRTEFISGTRNPVTFYYSATCCSTQAKITATDLRNNYNTYTIDVTVWDNLSEGEIAAIIVGALLILLIIILIIILIIFCVRKRKSHDLPYTQRYGSRTTPARAERTSF
ncbi:PREDICTED: uncharacterized protein LOC107065092 [Polistes dominula]|uniref:Uncharacterized protein LOC107065092 n=1 Tax=Polistes dominula TaxID=743375 RepID=A0ABM1I120_POLDO|nr:PREDICTED: uncharacterized protein LOC107065092 [Polistes dominula]XP_015173907.1 PREDICTED: uncharacterized protein LOC107065092 [Polistes dominula]